MTPTPLKPCVFFDRDGIVNKAPPPDEVYVLRTERFFLYPEFLKALDVVAARGYAAVIVTNQACVEKGLITREGVDAIHGYMLNLIRAAGRDVLAVYSCPHGGDHPDRKPRPGMLLRAAREHGIDLARSWMVGDQPRDILAGRAAGCARTVLVGAEGDCPEADARLAAVADIAGHLDRELPDLKTAKS